jgi:AcrR family transcriptional regulator
MCGDAATPLGLIRCLRSKKGVADIRRRGAQNDERTLRAIRDVLGELGWVGLTLRNVAERAEVARVTVSDRYANRSEMAIVAWQTGLGFSLVAAIEALLAIHALPHATRPTSLADAWRAFALPNRDLRGALVLLLASPFDPALQSVVHATIGAQATRWTLHNGRAATRQPATQRGYLIARALGLLAIGSMSDLRNVDFSLSEGVIDEALRQPVRASRLPVHPPPPVAITTGDRLLDALLQSTIEQVARHGFEGANLETICAGAGITKGYLFNRYPSKRELFIDAARRRQEAAVAHSIAWLNEMSARQGRARAEATFIRGVLHPSRWSHHRISGEELHLALREQELAAVFEATAASFARENLGAVTPITLGYAHSARAIGEGLGLLLLLDPDAWQLPFEVVLVPLQAALTKAYLGEGAT